MRGRSPSGALEAFLQPLRLLCSCLTDQPLLATGSRLSPQLHYASFVPVEAAAVLRTGAGSPPLGLLVRLDYVVASVEGSRRLFEATIVGYRYHVYGNEGQELVAYHWHPSGLSTVAHPHTHVSNAAWTVVTRASLSRVHFPTGMITLADVVQLLIGEFGVLPRRAEWEELVRAYRDPAEILHRDR